MAEKGERKAARRTKGEVRLDHILERMPAAAGRVENIKDMRNELAHAYPPASWRALHRSTEALLDELDGYKAKVADWLARSGVLSE